MPAKGKTQPKKAKKSAPKRVTIPLEEDANLKAIYSNFVSTQLTFWDIKLHFGQVGSDPDGHAIAKEVARIYMSPMHAKATLHLLTRQVESYERRFGEIALPENMGFKEEVLGKVN